MAQAYRLLSVLLAFSTLRSASAAAASLWMDSEIAAADAECAAAKRGREAARKIEDAALELQQKAPVSDLDGRSACWRAASRAKVAGRKNEVLEYRHCTAARALRSWKATSSPQGQEAMPVAVRGEVLVRGEKGFAPWDGKTPLRVGQTVRTGVGASVDLRLRGSSAWLTLGEGTEFTVGEDSPRMSRGTLYYWNKAERIALREKMKTLRSPNSAVGVRGTRFAAKVAEDGTETFALFEGEIAVTVSGSDQEIVLKAGEQLIVKDGKASAPEPVDYSTLGGLKP